MDNASGLIAALAGMGGIVAGKGFDLVMDRLKARDKQEEDQTVGVRREMSEQTKFLFEQQGVAIKDLYTQLTVVSQDRDAERNRANGLERRMAQVEGRMNYLERELGYARDQYKQATGKDLSVGYRDYPRPEGEAPETNNQKT